MEEGGDRLCDESSRAEEGGSQFKGPPVNRLGREAAVSLPERQPAERKVLARVRISFAFATRATPAHALFLPTRLRPALYRALSCFLTSRLFVLCLPWPLPRSP